MLEIFYAIFCTGMLFTIFLIANDFKTGIIGNKNTFVVVFYIVLLPTVGGILNVWMWVNILTKLLK